MNLLVLGAGSDAARALADIFASKESADVTLASRDLDYLNKAATDLAIRHGIQARAVGFDAIDFTSHQKFYDSLEKKPDVVVLAFGLLGDQKKAEKDFSLARRIMDTNYAGAVSILEIVAADFEKRGAGRIIALSSVAGLRGRKSNYIYGSAKAGLLTYLSGLRNRLHPSGAGVTTVLPGFMRTAMTENLDLPAALTASPEEAALAIHKAWRKGRDVVYVKWFWRYIMYVIRALPERIFKRTDI